ncbi:MAG: prepilin-type N-terminal cleavage/methylation domain-containing protein [Nitrospirae bacterium]|nr:prepilin-type N-terminal cleavage/methylation domain-containing protein [Nitrospirota bacterium]
MVSIREAKGFTFIEMMVVLAIMSVAMFVLVPRVINGILERGTIPLSEMNKLLDKAKHEAASKKETLKLKFVLGSNNYYYGEKQYSLPEGAELLEARVNEKRPEGLEFSVRIYPDGICDYFRLKLSNDKRIVSRPLLCEVKIEGV